MKFSSQIRYGVRILSALDKAEKPLSIAVLAAATGMSQRAAEGVLTVLKQSGVTGATSGPGGGIFLKRPLSEVSVGQLVDYFEQGVNFDICGKDLPGDCPDRFSCKSRKVLQDVSERVDGLLHQVSLHGILHNS